MNEAMKLLIEAVRKHALAHYEEDGWDYIVEAYDDEEIAAEIGFARTPTEAIANVRQVVKMLHERREDVQSEAW